VRARLFHQCGKPADLRRLKWPVRRLECHPRAAGASGGARDPAGPARMSWRPAAMR
jgi:hypothetical protein